MLSDKKIKDAIKNKEIEILISFIKKNGVPTLLDKEKNILDTYMKNQIYSDRLKLTMGPVVKVLKKRYINSKHRFKSNYDCFDLEKSNNKYTLNPGESIVILTNEHIKLNGKYACLIVPRISMSDVGIVVTTAYIDPYYDGILRLQLSNLSDKSYELNTLEVVAQCYFFELSDEVSKNFKDKFASKSVFFGQTWQGIYESDRSPFPTKKGINKDSRFENTKYQLGLIWSFIKKHSIIFLIITNLITLLGGYTLFMQNFDKYTTMTSQIASFFYPSASEIIVNAGEKYGEKEIIVEHSKTEIISILCNNDDIEYEVLSGDVENETKILFSICLPTEQIDRTKIEFTYTIIRRVKQ